MQQSNAARWDLQVMRHISEGLVAFMLERHDHAKPILRSVARELLSSCVLRSLMSFFNPYTANKVCPCTSHTTWQLGSGAPRCLIGIAITDRWLFKRLHTVLSNRLLLHGQACC